MFVLLGLIAILVLSVLLVKEIEVRQFHKKVVSCSSIPATFKNFKDLYNNPYTKFRVLDWAIPIYVKYAFEEKDKPFARAVIPYAEKLTRLEGARWQWHNLALLYLLVGEEKSSFCYSAYFRFNA